jgi:hypothetical protein
MQSFLLLLPAGLSAVVLAAHFLFHGDLLLMLASLALISLLWVRRSWAARVIQAGLLLGSAEWVRTLLVRVNERGALGEPYARFALILGAVALATAASALPFGTRRLRRRFGLPGS